MPPPARSRARPNGDSDCPPARNQTPPPLHPPPTPPHCYPPPPPRRCPRDGRRRPPRRHSWVCGPPSAWQTSRFRPASTRPAKWTCRWRAPGRRRPYRIAPEQTRPPPPRPPAWRRPVPGCAPLRQAGHRRRAPREHDSLEQLGPKVLPARRDVLYLTVGHGLDSRVDGRDHALVKRIIRTFFFRPVVVEQNLGAHEALPAERKRLGADGALLDWRVGAGKHAAEHEGRAAQVVPEAGREDLGPELLQIARHRHRRERPVNSPGGRPGEVVAGAVQKLRHVLRKLHAGEVEPAYGGADDVAG
eukprot:scaffold12213_cov115-Isochrysis_galbana.AAC.13